MKQSVLFLCTGNSCRSQMAEGFTRQLHTERFAAYSAGTAPQGLNPLAVRAMAEKGIDISANESTHVRDLLHKEFDYVITVCDSAAESCPVFPGKATVLHHGFEDPPKLARHAQPEEEAMVHYRRVRDEIERFVRELPRFLTDSAQQRQAK